jgi:hypothetical protein
VSSTLVAEDVEQQPSAGVGARRGAWPSNWLSSPSAAEPWAVPASHQQQGLAVLNATATSERRKGGSTRSRP